MLCPELPAFLSKKLPFRGSERQARATKIEVGAATMEWELRASTRGESSSGRDADLCGKHGSRWPAFFVLSTYVRTIRPMSNITSFYQAFDLLASCGLRRRRRRLAGA